MSCLRRHGLEVEAFLRPAAAPKHIEPDGSEGESSGDDTADDTSDGDETEEKEEEHAQPARDIVFWDDGPSVEALRREARVHQGFDPLRMSRARLDQSRPLTTMLRSLT